MNMFQSYSKPKVGRFLRHNVVAGIIIMHDMINRSLGEYHKELMKCQGILHCLESGHSVNSATVWRVVPCDGVTLTGWPQTWKTWNTQGFL